MDRAVSTAYYEYSGLARIAFYETYSAAIYGYSSENPRNESSTATRKFDLESQSKFLISSLML